jgi:hypothetical protein
MVVIRYEGPRGAPGMPEMLDPTSRITALCRQRGITIALMTDARFSGGSVGLVIGHISPEAALAGPIALLENGDTIVVDVNQDTLDCTELADPATLTARRDRWQAKADSNNGVHPLVRTADTRLLRRMRARALSPLQGAGLAPGDARRQVPGAGQCGGPCGRGGKVVVAGVQGAIQQAVGLARQPAGGVGPQAGRLAAGDGLRLHDRAYGGTDGQSPGSRAQ